MNPILEVMGINTFYGPSHILFDVSLRVEPGQTVCLIGRNGAGKTTTFRSIIGLTPPKTGRVVYKGRDRAGAPPYRMARDGICFVPEDRRILSPFSVAENLELGRIPGRTGRWDTAAVLDRFPTLARMLDRPGGALSGGEQQMLTIARALMGNPDVLLLDEPTEGLSPVIVGELKDLLLGLKAAETTILLSEQNLRFALAVSDAVAVIDQGQVVYAGDIASFRQETDIQKRYLAV